MEQYADVVIDLEGNAIQGATVQIFAGAPNAWLQGDFTIPTKLYDSNGTQQDQVVTDGRGAFAFQAPNGKYVLQVKVRGTIYATIGPHTFYDPAEDTDRVAASELAAPGGAGLVGTGQGSLADFVSEVQTGLVFYVTDFGADPTGATDSTEAFNRAKVYGASIGGARFVMIGNFMLNNFEVDVPRVIFEGVNGGYNYEKITDTSRVGTRLFPAAGSTWVFRLKGTSTGAAAQGSGLRNAVVMDTSPGAHQYGVIEDCAGTIIEDVTIQDFQYCHVMPAAVNANVHRRVARLGATKMGFLVSEFQAKSYMHPDVPDIPDIGNTVFFSSGGVIRQNEWGVMIRDAIGASLGDTVIESNRQAGMYIYRVDVSTVRSLLVSNVHFENNYDGITSDKSVYSIAGNRAFLIGGLSTYIAWTAANQAGYQLVIDSQTRTGTGGADNFLFDVCKFNCNNPYQRDIYQLSGVAFEYRRPNFGGTGDDSNRIRCTTDALATMFWEPSWKNDPTADVPSLIANFGANLGTRASLIRTGKRNGELGGPRADFGAFGGPMQLTGLPAGDPRRANENLLHFYRKLSGFPLPWRTGAALPFTVSNEYNYCLVSGIYVFIEASGTLTVNTTTGASDKFFADAVLPYQAMRPNLGQGNLILKATGGGATVLNNGISPMEMNAIASSISVLDVFPPLTVGMTFTYQVEMRYLIAD